MSAPKRRSPSALLNSPVFDLDKSAALSLQDQLRRKIVNGIVIGSLAPGRRLPSTRALADHLAVSRNTVALAYQQLIAEGHLVTRDRSGIFVNSEVPRGTAASARVSGSSGSSDPTLWRGRIKRDLSNSEALFAPPDWQRYPFPFVEGRFDRSLFPVAEWREASRRTLAVPEITQWATDTGDADDGMLIEELRTKFLPRRGIHARPDEILITTGSQQSLYLATKLLADSGTTVALEEPGHPELRLLLEERGASIRAQPVDDDGLMVNDQLSDCDVVFVSPGHQRPTGATMSTDRRSELLERGAEHDFVIVEDDFECETDYLDPSFPALRGAAQGDRVVYVATLAQTLAPGLRLGILVGPPSLIRAARALRRLTARHPPLSIQRTAAHLLALGHYDKIMMRVGRVFRDRLVALRDALNHYLPQSIAIAPVRGGTNIWVRGPDGLDANDIAAAAESRGVLIEPVRRYFLDPQAPKNVFRLGVTSISEDRIRDGIAVLAEVIREASGAVKMLAEDTQPPLKSEELLALLPGATLLGKTVYGDPCVIELDAAGKMKGRAGFANEDLDTGTWWVEDDLWCRQWHEWAYGEESRFKTVIDGDRIRWYNLNGRLVDSMVIIRD